MLLLLAFVDLIAVFILLPGNSNWGVGSILVMLLIMAFFFVLGLGLKNIYKDIFYKEYKELAGRYRFRRRHH